jgi:hypothetical protein
MRLGRAGSRGGRRAAAVAAVLVAVLGCAGLAAGVASAATEATVSLAVSPNPAQSGDLVTLTATVTGATSSPAGDVTFVSGALPIGTATLVPTTATDSVATFTTTFAAGTAVLTASYKNPDFSNSTSNAVTLVIGSAGVPSPTAVAVSISPATVVTGQPETITAVVTQTGGGTGVPTGVVAFFDNGVPLVPGQATLAGGIATLAASGFIAGTHVITASYLGDTFDSASTGTLTINAQGPSPAVQTTTTVTTTPNRITAGLSVLITAHVVQTGTPTAPPAGPVVSFYSDGVLLGQAPLDANGNASLTQVGWLTGTHVITASYFGDIFDLPSTGAYTLSVGPRPTGPPPTLTVAAPSPTLTYGGALPALSPAYTGFVSGDTVVSLVSPAVCTTTAASAPPAGTYPVTCSGAVDPNYTIVYTAGTLTVNRAPLTVAAANATIVAGQPLPPLTATISGFVNGQTLATSGVTGTPACTTTATSSSPAGTYPITCTLGTLAAANYGFSFTAGALTVTSPPSTCSTVRQLTDEGLREWRRSHGSGCETLLSLPIPDVNASVHAGQTLAIVYADETPLGSGSAAPTATVNGQPLAVTVTPILGRYIALLSFTLPSTLAPGTYTILVSAHDSDGHADLVSWSVTVVRAGGKGDDKPPHGGH